MIDTDGYRLNVGVILTNRDGKVFWAKRVNQNAWQFPQGGIKAYENSKQAMFRELYEEVGLTARNVEVLGNTRSWLRYRLPNHLIRYHQRPLCIGQKQMWFVLRLTGKDSDINLDCGKTPEFDSWKWVDYLYPLQEVVYFKRNVYETALQELQTLALPQQVQQRETVRINR